MSASPRPPLDRAPVTVSRIKLYTCPSTSPVRSQSQRETLQVRRFSRASLSPRQTSSPRLNITTMVHPPVVSTSAPVLLGSATPPPCFVLRDSNSGALQNALRGSHEALCAQARRAGAAEALLRERAAKFEQENRTYRASRSREPIKELGASRLQTSSTTNSLTSSASISSENQADIACEKSVREKLTEMLITAECEAAKARHGETEQRSRADETSREVVDLNSQMQTLASEQSSLEAQLMELKAKFDVSEQERLIAQESLQRVSEEREQLSLALADSATTTTALTEGVANLSEQLTTLKDDFSQKTETLQATSEHAERMTREHREMEVALRSYKAHHGLDDNEQLKMIADLEVKVDQLSTQMEAATAELGAEHVGAVELKARHLTLEHQLVSAEIARIRMHNTIQELRGNIRVICRVRPTPEGVAVALRMPEPNVVHLNHTRDDYSFNLDKVFGPSASQSDVFQEVDGIVQSALDGYKVCVFAYGQTGSGKTHTMQGGDATGTSGIVPRALAKIFSATSSMQSRGWSWSLQVSIMEVYNENLRDLLRGGGDSAAGPTDRHVIVQHDAWGTMVAGMSCIKVDSLEHVNALMVRASKQRACAATDMNADSSRSHLITAVYLKGINVSLDAEHFGALHFVDLAGSERLEKSGSTGDRLKETQNINKSLSCLAHVFAAKAEGASHVPFRNSKLTHLMEPCLSGHGKTVMFVNVQPSVDQSHETLCSLRFAKQVSQCHTGGKAKRSVSKIGSGNSGTKPQPPPKSTGSLRAHRPAPSLKPQRLSVPINLDRTQDIEADHSVTLFSPLSIKTSRPSGGNLKPQRLSDQRLDRLAASESSEQIRPRITRRSLSHDGRA